MAKKTVLNCITGLNIGGAEYMMVRFLRHMSRETYSPAVLSLMRPGPLQRLVEEEGIDLHSLEMRQSRIGPASLSRLRGITRRCRPDLVHGWMYHGNIAGSLASFMHRRVPTIWSIHHSLDDLRQEKPLTRFLIRLSAKLSFRTAAISYCSAISAAQHEKLGFDPSKRHIIPNGVNCDEFRPDPDAGIRLRNMLGLPEQRLLIGNAGRAHPMKDHANLVRAAAILLSEGLDVQCVIVGEGHEGGAAERTARDLGIRDRLSLPGPRSDMQALMPAFDIYALSSGWGEAFPLAVSEAMASGVPAVATDIGDCSWLIGDKAFIAAPQDPAALAAPLRALARLSRDERRDLGRKARQRVVDEFSIDRYVARHETLYRQALDLS